MRRKDHDADRQRWYDGRMSEPPSSKHPSQPTVPTIPTTRTTPRQRDDATVICERCGADMFRMHAVWRCPKCRYKTDCCGW